MLHGLKFPKFWMAILALTVLAGCGGGDDITAFAGETMGTTYSVQVARAPELDSEIKQLPARVQEVLDDINARMSTYQPDSELSRFNASDSTEPFPVSPATAEVVAEALEVSRLTDGAFDVTVGPLVNAWGFGPEGRVEPPGDEEVERLRERVGYHLLDVDLENSTLRKKRPDVYVDLSAIAKGYAVDQVAEMLNEAGFVDHLVEVGGEIRAGGLRAPGRPWRVGIEKPDPKVRSLHTTVPLSNYGLATSGDYRNFFVRDGEHYSHAIDPRSGKPVRHKLASASVIHWECAKADAFATAFMVLGGPKAMEVAEREGIAAVLIFHQDDGGFAEAATSRYAPLVAEMRKTAGE